MKKIIVLAALLTGSMLFSQDYDYLGIGLPRLDHADNFYEFDGERFPADFQHTLADVKKSAESGKYKLKETVEKDHTLLELYYLNIMFYSQSFNKKGLPDGPAAMYYGNGQVIQDIPFVKGKALGAGHAYDKDGLLLVETNYKDNKRHGIRRIFSRRGDVTIEGSFVNDEVTDRIKVEERRGLVYYYPPDMKKGTVECYAGTAKVADIPILDKNIYHGAVTEYNGNGLPKKISRYFNGGRQGKTDYYKNDGSLWFSNDYNDGKPVGGYKFLDDNGVALQEGNYNGKGQKTGTWISRNRQGITEKEENYNNTGQLHGMLKNYSNGVLIEETPYAKGRKEGISKSYDRAGVLESERSYTNNDQLYYKGYYPDGTLFTESVTKGGKVFSAVYYEPSGKILHTNKYNDKGMPIGIFKQIAIREGMPKISSETHFDKDGVRIKAIQFGYTPGSYTETYYRKDLPHGPQTNYNSKTNEKKVTYMFDGKTVTEKEFEERSKKQKP